MSDSTNSGSPASDDSNSSDRIEGVEPDESQSGGYRKSEESTEEKFPNEALAHVRVLDVGEPAREVARQLGLEIQSALPEPGERPVVLVVSEPSEVDTLLDVENRAWIGFAVSSAGIVLSESYQISQGAKRSSSYLDMASHIAGAALGAWWMDKYGLTPVIGRHSVGLVMRRQF